MPTVLPSAIPAFVQVAGDGVGKRIANYAVQMYIDAQDGNGPVLQTVYFQAVDAFHVDENGNRIAWDDRVDYEWKRQLLDEMRAIRIGMEFLLESGAPSYNLTMSSLLAEAQGQRIDPISTGDFLEQES